MRHSVFIALFGVSLCAQNPPNCTGIALDVDARCGCVKDPNSDLCKLVKMGAYNTDPFRKTKPLDLGLGGTIAPERPVRPPASARRARPQQARVFSLAHADYLRVLHPKPQVAAGFDFQKAFQSPEVFQAVFGKIEDADNGKVAAALKEIDHLWISYAAPNDLVVLATGKFEQGAAAGILYSKGIQPVFLNDAHAMMIGSEPSLQAAFNRLSKPVQNAATAGWAMRRARELSRDYETWVVTDSSHARPGNVHGILQFALAFRLAGEGSIHGEAVAESEAGASEFADWIERSKSAMRDKDGTGAMDWLTVKRDGVILRFTGSGGALPSGDAAKSLMNSDFGVDLYALTMAGFPGAPARTVPADKLRAVRTGMKKDEALALLGQPLSVFSIQGLNPVRETWTYQVPFGKSVTLQLEGGVVTAPPR
jgi:hypothetical protein